jgi:hypothetical protein
MLIYAESKMQRLELLCNWSKISRGLTTLPTLRDIFYDRYIVLDKFDVDHGKMSRLLVSPTPIPAPSPFSKPWI